MLLLSTVSVYGDTEGDRSLLRSELLNSIVTWKVTFKDIVVLDQEGLVHEVVVLDQEGLVHEVVVLDQEGLVHEVVYVDGQRSALD